MVSRNTFITWPHIDLLGFAEKLNLAKPNMGVLKDYAKREQEWLRRAQDYDNVSRLRDEQKEKYERLRNQRLTEFMSGFNTISLKLKEMYQVRFVLRELPRFH